MSATSQTRRPPRVPAYRKGGQLLVRCPYCGSGHFHGVGDTQPGGVATRGPHCNDYSLRQGDYDLVYEGDVTEGYLTEFYRARRMADRRPPKNRSR